MNFAELSRSGLFAAVVENVRNSAHARQILEQIGYPRAGRPAFPRGDDWLDFWTEICTSIEGGRIRSGNDLRPLVEAVAQIYPANPVFKSFQAGHQKSSHQEVSVGTPSQPAAQLRPSDNSSPLSPIANSGSAPSPHSDSAIRTVLELDLVGYSTSARPLQEDLGATAVQQFQDQIQGFIDRDFDRASGFEPEIVILTAVPVELNAVLARMLPPYPQSNNLWRVIRGNLTYFLGRIGCHRVVSVMCEMGSGGPGGATLASSESIRVWKPKAVIMVGIAFGRDPQTQDLGDVLVAQQVVPYGNERVGAETSIPRAEHPPSSLLLRNRFNNVLEDWRYQRPDGTLCQMLIGPVLSGPKLVDNTEFRNELFEQFPKAIGGEMEGEGLYAGAEAARVHWILVKAICDWADGHKHERAQPMAAASAISLVEHVLAQKNLLDGASRPSP